MKKIIKSIFIFLSFLVVMTLSQNVNALSITSESTGMYFTFMKENGHRFSDEMVIYRVDGKITYCIEPGVSLGSSGYYQGDLSNLDEAKRKRIEDIMYYGYINNDINEYIAAQALIWEELLPTSSSVVFSTQLFEKGNIISLDNYKTMINNRIFNKYDLIDRNRDINISVGYGSHINTNVDLNDYNITYDSNALEVHINQNIIVVGRGLIPGEYEIKLEEKNKYDYPYIIYKNDSKQDLLVVGNINPINKVFKVKVTGGSLALIKTDKETEEKVSDAKYGLFNQNDELIFEIITDDEGKGVIYNQIPYGLYYLKEIEAPIGYELDETKHYLEFSKSNKDITLFLTDNKIEGELLIVKKDMETNEVIPDTTFNIMDEDNNVIDSITTDKEGKASIKLKYGKYYYQEIKSNDKYELDDIIHEINIDESIIYIRDVYNNKIPQEDELIIPDVPNTNKYSYIPFILFIGVVIVQKEINYYYSR